MKLLSFSKMVLLAIAGTFLTNAAPSKIILAGTWILTSADVVRPGGSRGTDRPKFASGDKKKGTPPEYEAALLGLSTHYGLIVMAPAMQTLEFRIDNAAYPNWEHTVQTREFKLEGDVLSYQVAATAATGTIAVSVWHRVKRSQ